MKYFRPLKKNDLKDKNQKNYFPVNLNYGV